MSDPDRVNRLGRGDFLWGDESALSAAILIFFAMSKGWTRTACRLGAFGRWGFLGKNAQNLPGGIHQTKGVRFFAGMAPGDIMRPQLSGCDRLGRARQDRGFRLDHNASLEPNDCKQFGLLSA